MRVNCLECGRFLRFSADPKARDLCTDCWTAPPRENPAYVSSGEVCRYCGKQWSYEDHLNCTGCWDNVCKNCQPRHKGSCPGTRRLPSHLL